MFGVVAAVLFAIAFLTDPTRPWKWLFAGLFFLALDLCWDFGVGLWQRRGRVVR